MPSDSARLLISISPAADADAQEVSELVQQLRRELLNSEADTIEPVHGGAAPPGAKGDPITLANLAVTIAPAAVGGLIRIVQAWVSRHDRASVTVESGAEKLTVTGDPSAEQRQMVDAFLRRQRR
jgi:hypothetical protein